MAASPKPQLESLQFGVSLAALHRSEYVGVTVGDRERIIEANNAFLHMLGLSRSGFRAGSICQRDVTPREHWLADDRSFLELELAGACVPYEKELLRRDGTRVSVIVSSVRLHNTPSRFVSVIIDVSERKRSNAIEQRNRDLEARTALVNLLAHEINNPLAVLTNMFYLLNAQGEMPQSARPYLDQGAESLARITAAVKAILSTAQGK
jgi:PAS domain S-box-containing protein